MDLKDTNLYQLQVQMGADPGYLDYKKMEEMLVNKH